jgi:hypothetical protein
MSQPTWKPARASNSSWTIKGVTETTREAVREAVAQSDMLIGEWVEEALRQAAHGALNPAPPPATQADVATLRQEVGRELAEIRTMLQALAERTRRSEPQDRPVVRHVLVERRRSARIPGRPGRKGDEDAS